MTEKNLKSEIRNPKLKIVVFNVNWLGDVLFSTPAIGLIRQAYPDAFIACIIPPRCREILEGNHNLDEIIIYDEAGKHKSVSGKLRFINELRREKFNKGFLFHRSFTRALIFFLAGISERIGYANKKRNLFLTAKIDPPDIGKVHRADYYLGIVRAYLNAPSEFELKLDFFSQKEVLRVDSLLKENGIKEGDIVVALNPGGNWPQKRWPKENFASLAKKLVENYDAKVVITGADKDISLGEEIAALSKNKIYNFCAKLTLKEMAALAKIAKVFISGDSGPLHVAYAIGAKVIGLYGPTSVLITGPYHADNAVVIQRDVGCDIPCYEERCKELCCMKAITVEEVLAQVISKIKT